MRIAQVAPPFELVPPNGYGGTESVVSTLTEALVALGHEATLFAAGGSHTSAHLHPTVEQALWHGSQHYDDPGPFLAVTAGKLLSRLQEFDVVHSHIDYAGLPLARAAARPLLTTLHGRLDLPAQRPLFEEFAEVPLVSISLAQRRPVSRANWAANIYHGIDLESYPFNPRPQDYVAFLGRFSPEKGAHTAVRVAREVGVPLRIAARLPLSSTDNGNVRQDWDYFHDIVEPLLGAGVEFMGEVSGPEKAQFLGNARALLFPIEWPEPFGLVMIEALACGTPVIALDRGSVPEVLTDGVTGFVCRNEKQMVDALRRVEELDRLRCREEAARRFSASRMAEEYEQLYRRLA